MMISRRAFAGGAIGAVAALHLPGRAAASGFGDSATMAAERIGPALNAIAAYARTHLQAVGLPGLTLGLSLPDGSSRTLNFGVANVAAQTPIGPATLFQVGSISKLMSAAVLAQLASEGRFAFTDQISALLAGLPLPPANGITVQHLLDHLAGLAADAPLDPEGGLWIGYPPGQHWHYSNTGYEILGLLAQKFGGKSMAQLVEQRIFRPLGMTGSVGAIRLADRARYATGYQPANEEEAFVPGGALGEARWIDEAGAAGGVASTAEDMSRLLRSLADAAQGRGGLGLPPALARTFAQHAVPTDTIEMTYGNALMHVGNGPRTYLHHTGGMVGFSSSFHLDPVSGVAAFASSNIGFLAEYRPRLLTLFAVNALTEALAGKPIPRPPPVGIVLPVPAAYSGHFAGPSGSFEVRLSGASLAIIAGGRSDPLIPVGGDLFRTAHPAFRRYSLLFERRANTIGGASWGPLSYLRSETSGLLPPSNPALARLAGRFVNDSPWFGAHQLVERGGRLWIGTEVPLTPIGQNLWRVGQEPWSPERASFADFDGDVPATLIWSGEKFVRRDIQARSASH
ncbi:MAG: serine hydrolase domain-containing protein [Sphingomicrobium sp.]